MCVSHYTQPISKETKFAELFIFYIVSKGEDRVLKHIPNFLIVLWGLFKILTKLYRGPCSTFANPIIVIQSTESGRLT